MLKIAVCDDNPDFLKSAVQMIERWSQDIGIPTEVLSFTNGDDLITANLTLGINIIFLDIIMPLLNGMETAREIRQTNKAVKIYFLTSSPEFALESYDVKANGYLLKPIAYEKIHDALDECALSFDKEPKNLVLKTAVGYQKMYLHDIEYVEAQNKRVIFHFKSGKSVEVIVPLYHIENSFTDTDVFFKCHRSYIVNLQNVNSFNSNEITTGSGKLIPIARGLAKAFKEAYFEIMFRE